jgi:hypothetical protein
MNMTEKKLLVSPLHPLELNISFPLATFIIEVIFFVSPGVYKKSIHKFHVRLEMTFSMLAVNPRERRVMYF